MNMISSGRVIVALDFDGYAPARRLVDQLGESAQTYKVGLQLLAADGPRIVRELVAVRKQVFLDLKLLEIPNSVAGAVDAAGRLGASMVTVHAVGGSKVLRAAVEAARPFPRLAVLGLTVITSTQDEDLAEVGVDGTVREQVVRLSQLAATAGCHGVVASAQEAALVREVLPATALIVTPGVQLAGDDQTDQVRVSSPGEAIRAGATHLVIGRSITRSPDPVAALRTARAQVASALSA